MSFDDAKCSSGSVFCANIGTRQVSVVCCGQYEYERVRYGRYGRNSAKESDRD